MSKNATGITTYFFKSKMHFRLSFLVSRILQFSVRKHKNLVHSEIEMQDVISTLTVFAAVSYSVPSSLIFDTLNDLRECNYRKHLSLHSSQHHSRPLLRSQLIYASQFRNLAILLVLVAIFRQPVTIKNAIMHIFCRKNKPMMICQNMIDTLDIFL